MSQITTERPRIEFAPRYFCEVSASSSSPFRDVGTVTLKEQTTFHFAAGYPGADYWLVAEPQTVTLQTNGYYVRAVFNGTITRRGYYGGDVGVPGTYHWRPYAYEADWVLAGWGPDFNRQMRERYEITLA